MKVETERDHMSTSPPERKTWLAVALDKYEGPLLRYAQRRVGDLETARDIVQECFLRLCKQRRDDVGDHLAPWLYTVCRNLSIDHLRKDGRMHALDDATLDAKQSTDAPPTHLAEAADQRTRLMACIDRLSPRQQEMVRLKFQDGLSYREIAEVTKASVGNVGFILHTAVKALRAQMGEHLSPATTGRTK